MTGQDQTSGTGNRFLNEILALRQAARDVMAAQAGGPAATTALLQTALSAEIVCVMRYTAISISQDGLKNNRIGAEFQEQANDERRHMSIVAARIEQLGGTPDYNHHPVRDRGSFMTTPAAHFLDLVHENLTAEKCVVELYHDLIALFTPHDPVTCAMLREIVRDEEDHTGDMEDLVALHAT